MSVGIAQVSVLAAALLAAGLYLAAREVREGRTPFAVVLIFGAAALELTGVSRFAASTRDPLSGQAFAVVLMFLVPGLVALLSRSRPDEQ